MLGALRDKWITASVPWGFSPDAKRAQLAKDINVMSSDLSSLHLLCIRPVIKPIAKYIECHKVNLVRSPKSWTFRVTGWVAFSLDSLALIFDLVFILPMYWYFLPGEMWTYNIFSEELLLVFNWPICRYFAHRPFLPLITLLTAQNFFFLIGIWIYSLYCAFYNLNSRLSCILC